ncbi:flagellar protein FlgN [Achromobacter xylosoxidans]
MSPVESLQACLRQEDTLITEFSSILEEETKVLVGPGNVDALHDITERKSQVAQQLVDLSQTRDGLLAEIGLPAGHAGTEQAAVLHPQLSGVWQALLAKSASANEINLRNGALIDVHLRYTQQSLDALRNLGGMGGPSTYDAQGRGRHAGPQVDRRRLASPCFKTNSPHPRAVCFEAPQGMREPFKRLRPFPASRTSSTAPPAIAGP